MMSPKIAYRIQSNNLKENFNNLFKNATVLFRFF